MKLFDNFRTFQKLQKITKKSQENYIINKIFLNISDLRLTLNPYLCVYKKNNRFNQDSNDI